MEKFTLAVDFIGMSVFAAMLVRPRKKGRRSGSPTMAEEDAAARATPPMAPMRLLRRP